MIDEVENIKLAYLYDTIKLSQRISLDLEDKVKAKDIHNNLGSALNTVQFGVKESLDDRN